MKTECTFQEACTKCKKEGGKFWLINALHPVKYSWYADKQTFINQHGSQFKFDGSEFNLRWIYEPPQKSAFQEWCDKTEFYYDEGLDQSYDAVAELVNREREKGWNAHHEAVVKLISEFSFKPCPEYLIEQIEKLREP
jgi:hypothetical protein